MSSTPSTPAPRTPADPLVTGVAVAQVDLEKYSLGFLREDGPAVGDRITEVITSPENAEHNFGETNKAHIGRGTDDVLDPLLLAAAIASGPHVTRHHYHHSFRPDEEDNVHFSNWSKWVSGVDEVTHQPVVSKQAPRSERLRLQHRRQLSSLSRSTSSSPDRGFGNKLFNKRQIPILTASPALSASSDETPSLSPSSSVEDLPGLSDCENRLSTDLPSVTQTPHKGDGQVKLKCMVRTRVPTPHGEVFLHLYHNDRDKKEHLAIVVDPAQFSRNGAGPLAPFIRSRSLDSVWDTTESEMDRITRGAYIGRLSEAGFSVSSPTDAFTTGSELDGEIPAPLVRIHSECFTGETIGSLRCDCGEQLDEAIRRISQPVPIKLPSGELTTIPGRGAVIYMRQEGRGIGLLSKLRAYNLQDLGYDTVQANLMLGHGADERGYEVAAAIIQDLGLGGEEGVRLLTNNPDKVQSMEKAGVRIAERVSMVPRSWRCQSESSVELSSTETHIHTHGHQVIGGSLAVQAVSDNEDEAARLRSAGATLIGAGTASGPDLEKYLRTKVLRMGHMLSLPPSDATVRA